MLCNLLEERALWGTLFLLVGTLFFIFYFYFPFSLTFSFLILSPLFKDFTHLLLDESILSPVMKLEMVVVLLNHFNEN